MRWVLAVLACAAVFGVSSPAKAATCGADGYSYAGLAAPTHAFGIGATVTPLATFSISTGHVAGWVGVGGPGEGPGGKDEGVPGSAPVGRDEGTRAGYNAIGGIGGPNLYYEVTRAGGQPTYHQIAANLRGGQPERGAVLQLQGRSNWWRVWVNGEPVTQPIYLPGSHGRWSPIATAESWDGGSGGACNAFLYRFHGVKIASGPAGGWARAPAARHSRRT